MEKEKIKQVLNVLGISEKLLGKPAVMERIYPILKETKDIKDLMTYVTISDDKKNVHVGNYNFKELDTDEILLTYTEQSGDPASVLIDKYGMDSEFSAGNDLYYSISVARQDNRQLLVESHNEGTATIDKNYVQDSGDAILNYSNYTILKIGATPTFGWEQNKAYLTREYPITKEWFEQKEKMGQENNLNNEIEEKEKIDFASEKNTPEQKIVETATRIEIQEELIHELQDANQILKKENGELIAKNMRLQKMLDAALEVCDNIKKSKAGKIFFKTQLRNMPESNEGMEK